MTRETALRDTRKGSENRGHGGPRHFINHLISGGCGGGALSPCGKVRDAAQQTIMPQWSSTLTLPQRGGGNQKNEQAPDLARVARRGPRPPGRGSLEYLSGLVAGQGVED